VPCYGQSLASQRGPAPSLSIRNKLYIISKMSMALSWRRYNKFSFGRSWYDQQKSGRLYNDLIANEEWMFDLHEADAIIVSHSQGSIVSAHLLNRLIQDNHFTSSRNHTLYYFLFLYIVINSEHNIHYSRKIYCHT